MSKTKLSLIILMVLFTLGVSAQGALQSDPASGKISFKASFHLDKNISSEEAFGKVQEWVNNNITEFSRSNQDKLNGVSSSKNEREVEAAFDNSMPLQSIDPESNRLLVKCISKYQGNRGGSIRLMYVEYYLVATIENNEINIEVSNFTYNHYNPQSFAPMNIYSWADGKPFDSVNTLEALLNSETSSVNEISNFGAYLNKDVHSMLSDFGNYMARNSTLTASTIN